MGRWLVICHLFSELLGDLPFIFTSFCCIEELKTCFNLGFLLRSLDWQLKKVLKDLC